MVEKIIIIILSFIVGILVDRVMHFVEINSLKDQLIDAENTNEAIVKDNADLSRQNDILRRKLWDMEHSVENKNIPKFGDWYLEISDTSTFYSVVEI